MKKLYAAFAVFSLLLASCISVKPVELKRIENLSVSGSNNSLTLTFSLVFFNPNGFSCTITDITSEGALRNQLLFRTVNGNSISAKSNSDFAIPVTANVSNKDFGQVLGAGISLLLSDESIPMNIKGNIKVKKWFFTKSFYFESDHPINKAQLRKLF